MLTGASRGQIKLNMSLKMNSFKHIYVEFVSVKQENLTFQLRFSRVLLHRCDNMWCIIKTQTTIEVMLIYIYTYTIWHIWIIRTASQSRFNQHNSSAGNPFTLHPYSHSTSAIRSSIYSHLIGHRKTLALNPLENYKR